MSVPPSGYPPAGGFGPGGEPGARRTRPDEDTIIAGGPAGPVDPERMFGFVQRFRVDWDERVTA